MRSQVVCRAAQAIGLHDSVSALIGSKRGLWNICLEGTCRWLFTGHANVALIDAQSSRPAQLSEHVVRV